MNMKNGFTTLNRLLGKKSKSQTMSKSTTSLSIRPQSQYDTSATLSSQLEHNSLTSLPTAASNAPFEQTFRITVLLPKSQLYVTRLGARTELGTLLKLVCENKRLDPTKYEFRHPADSSQVFGPEQTLGAVGLYEIRLCLKSESYDNFNATEIISLRNTAGRDSLSSSEFSSRNSKNTLKTASPYSSTNSLNSSDSAGMSLSYRGTLTAHPSQQTYLQKPPVAPARKKRAAPRPPSQQSMIVVNGGGEDGDQTPTTPSVSKEPLPLARKEFHVSTPNLGQCSEMTLLRSAEFHKSNVSVDCNGNSRNSRDNNSLTNVSNDHLHCNGTGAVHSNVNSLPSPTLSETARHVSMSVLNNEIHYDEKELNGNREFVVNGSVADLTLGEGVPEPAPRKRIIMLAKKKAAPAPPPRGMHQPIATPRITTTQAPSVIAEVSPNEEALAESVPNEGAVTENPEPLKGDSEVFMEAPRTKPEEAKEDDEEIPPSLPTSPLPDETEDVPETNVVKEEPKRKLLPPPLTNGFAGNHIEVAAGSPQLRCLSVTETPPPTPVSPATDTTLESKISLESSDDDEHVNVYNLKLGRTTVTPLAAYEAKTESFETTEQPSLLSVQTAETASSPISTMSPATPQRAESPEWSYTIPAPPKFADNETVAATFQSTPNCMTPNDGSILSDADDLLSTNSLQNDVMITSDIEDGYRGGQKDLVLPRVAPKGKENVSQTAAKERSEVILKDLNPPKSASPPQSPVDLQVAEVINELNNIINENKDTGSLKRRTEKKNEMEIEAAKPCVLSNFVIQSYSTKPSMEAETMVQEKSPEIVADEESLYIKSGKRPSLTLSNSVVGHLSRQRSNIARSDSFHSTRNKDRLDSGDLSASLSASHTSLAIEQRTNLNDRFLDTNHRKSSSELSIGETPSLQSPMIMRSILNSRKNSLNGVNSSSVSNLRSPEIVESLKSKPVEVKTGTTLIEIRETDYRRPSLKDLVSISSVSAPLIDSHSRNSFENPPPKASSIEPKVNGWFNSNSQAETAPTPGEQSTVVQNDSDSSKENSPKNKIIVSQTKLNEEPRPEKAIENQKIYRYQGQPNINLSTWSERPKVQVAIKSDTDYISGTGTGTAHTNHFPIINGQTKSQPPSIDGTSTVQLRTNGNGPVAFRNVDYRKTISTVEILRPRERKISEDDLSKQQSGGHQQQFLRPVSVCNPLSLGRTMPKMNRFTPVVTGFKSLDAAIPSSDLNGGEPQLQLQSRDDKNHTTVVLRSTANIVRSNSAVSTTALRLSTVNNNISIENDDSKSPPTFYSQVALRKTGLKEKIIASNDSVDSPPTKSTSHLHRTSINQQQQPQNCAKLELKLTTTVTSSNPPKSPTKPNIMHRHTIASEIPPPPPPIIRSLVTKQNSLGKSACIPDTRDQLLIAIRNFNKDALKGGNRT